MIPRLAEWAAWRVMLEYFLPATIWRSLRKLCWMVGAAYSILPPLQR